MSLFPARSRQAAEQEAADWAARLDGGPLSRADTSALRDWLDLNPAHAFLLHDFQTLYSQVKSAVPVMVQAGDLPRPRPKSSARPVVAWSSVLAATAAILLAVWLANRPERFSTPFAGHQSFTFSDGSMADLNARSVLAVSLNAHDRRVRLTAGEAYFAVAKDPSRPFFVETPAGTVRVTGTHFDVRADDPQSLEVTVLEGSVSVTPLSDSPPVRLKSREQYSLDAGSASIRELTPEAARSAIAWREGRVVFSGAPLFSAVQRFARYHDRPIEVTSSAAALRLGGSFRLDDLDGFLRDLESAVPVHVFRTPDGRIRIVAR
jgi:transmembrane sensor